MSTSDYIWVKYDFITWWESLLVESITASQGTTSSSVSTIMSPTQICSAVLSISDMFLSNLTGRLFVFLRKYYLDPKFKSIFLLRWRYRKYISICSSYLSLRCRWKSSYPCLIIVTPKMNTTDIIQELGLTEVPPFR